jgi:hypothetical protein
MKALLQTLRSEILQHSKAEWYRSIVYFFLYSYLQVL